MIQAFGLTSDSRKDLPPSIDDVSFEAHGGRVTALLGTAGSGKTTTLRLMLELQRGCGITYFKGRPLHRIAHPSREVGVLLGDVPGHPARTVRGHLRMLCAAAGLPARRADEVLEAVGLVSFRDERLGTLSRGLDRRLGLACVLLADPHTLVLDAPSDGLSAREGRWLHGVLRAHAAQGGTVLFTTGDPKEAAGTADRVVTLERGRLVADQEAADFARHRLRPRVTVRSPHAARLGTLLAKEARTGRRSVEVVRESGNRLSVYGSTCADVGETAFRHGILIHQLAHEVGDMGAGAGSAPSAVAMASVEEPRTEAVVTAAPDGEQPVTVVPATVVPAAGKRQPPPATAALAASAAAAPRSEGARLAGGEEGGAFASSPADGSSADPAPGEPPVPTRPEAASLTPPPDEASGAAHGLGSPLELRAKVASPVVRKGNQLPVLGAGEGTPATRGADGADLKNGSEGPGTIAHPDDPVARGAGVSGPTTTSVGGPVRTRDSQTSGTAAGPDDRAPAPATVPLGPTDGSEALGLTAVVETRVAAYAPEADDSTTSSEPEPEPEPEAAVATAAPAATPHVVTSAHPSIPTPRPAESAGLDGSSNLPPPISVRPGPGPLRPLRYELRRATGVGTGFLVGAAVLVCSALTALVMGRMGHAPQPRVLAAWPRQLPLPPAALGAGLLGAFAFGDEFRHPALAADRGTVPRRLGLLAAKLTVAGATALLLALLTVGCDAEVLYAVYGQELAQVPGDWLSLGASWLSLVVGCAWAGVLAAGVFRSTTAGLAAVLSVPVLVVPLVQKAMGGKAWNAAGLPARLRRAHLLQWPFGGDRQVAAAARLIAQPLGGALALTLVALLCAYLLTLLRSRAR
ncbi:ATP-binding cassette domain-containing protein [Streptomyces sp. NPDC014889]|uniref:ATP-binding cassette domain-containing protein n=1 Tax=Streptomyces sp. NPDC014889 TaxID=3364928 RepID=UPI0036F82F39